MSVNAVERRLKEAAAASAASYKAEDRNPWAPVEGNIDMRTGRYSDHAVSRQMSCVRALGPEKAAEIAGACCGLAASGAKLGDLYAPGYTNRAR